MSREYYFYPSEKRHDSYYPALLEPDNGDFDPAACYWTNADCVSDEVKELFEDRRIDPGNMKGEFAKYMNLDDCEESDLKMIYVYELSYDFIRNHSGSGLVIGYTPVDTVIEANRDDVPLSEYKYELIPPEIYTEHPHKDSFIRVSFIDYTSLEHICGILDIALSNLKWYEKELCMLVHYPF